MNIVKLSGMVSSEPNIVEDKFLKFNVMIPRKSMTMDFVPVTIPLDVIKNEKEIHNRNYVEIEGTFRSVNKVEGGKGKLVLFVYGKNVSIAKEPVSPKNEICFNGFLCKPVIYRITPRQFEVADLILANNEPFESNYFPCVAWGRNAKFARDAFGIGSEVGVVGRIQSRNYEKVVDGKTETRTAYEVSIGELSLLSANLKDNCEETSEKTYNSAKNKNIIEK